MFAQIFACWKQVLQIFSSVIYSVLYGHGYQISSYTFEALKSPTREQPNFLKPYLFSFDPIDILKDSVDW